MKAYWKDIWRTVSKGKKRFISIALIATLGVTMMCGLRAACVDLRYSADRFFDEQNLFDIRILSTLGLTDDDVKALEKLDSVELADGGYSENVYTLIDGAKKSIEIRTLSTQGMNMPYLTAGKLPEKANEIVITEKYKNETGHGIGDQIKLTEESEYLKSQTYTIVGIITDTLDINNPDGSMSFRANSSTDYVGYIAADAADSDIYSVVYLKLKGLQELNCYSDGYKAVVDEVVEEIESYIKADREQARYDEIYNEAMDEWLEGEQEMLDEFAKADEEIAEAKQEIADAKVKLADARQELEDGKAELIDGEKELRSQEAKAEKEFANAREEIAAGYEEIENAEAQYAQLLEGQAQLEAQIEAMKAQMTQVDEMFASYFQQIEEQESVLDEQEEQLALQEQQLGEQKLQLDEQKQQLDEAKAQLDAGVITDPEQLEQAYQELESKYEALDEGYAQIEQGYTQIEQGYATIEEARAKLEQAKAELEAQVDAAKEQALAQAIPEQWAQITEQRELIANGIAQFEENAPALEEAKAQLEAGEKELNAQELLAKKQLAAGWQEIADGWYELEKGEIELADGEKELADGEKELEENVAEYEEEKAKAEKELADAKKEIEEIEMATWYVQDRTSLSGYANVESDADSIQAIGDIFPVLFLTVAILISLTTITRMVEEERGLIGTYKAMGFSNAEIRRKYLIYAAAACLIGGLIGDIGGYVILPQIIFIVFDVMYVLPDYWMQFDLLYGLGGILLFEVGVVGATIYSSKKALRQVPAKLMRPKTPKSGSRVLLERISFIWKRLSFLNKVTARNIFRYKKRMLMTVFGIAGCTSLLLIAFTIKDTVSEMMPQQYGEVYEYDLMTVVADDDYEELEDILESDNKIENYISARIESAEIINEAGKEETVQVIVIPNGESLEGYIKLKDKDNHKVELGEDDILLTRNAIRVLDLELGDTIDLQTLDLEQAEITITGVVENYFGNTVYMTESKCEELFGEFKVNGTLALLSEKCDDHRAYTDELKREEIILSAVSTQVMKDDFSTSFALINMVVYVILVLAALLAFVVLFTLSNINISERERELATIKVLGFYHPEVHSYVNKETWILTLIGILAGMPLGWGLGRYVMGILKFPSLEFYIDLYPQSYLFAAAITLIFAFVVNLITNKSLDKINMVEALKSVE